MEEILKRLKEKFGELRLELDFETPYQLLVAATLSAQTQDKRVNQVTRGFFDKVKEPEDLLKLGKEKFLELIKPINFSKRKGEFIWRFTEELVERFGGKVPEDVEVLSQLPGVGRKTANMVIAGAYGKPAVVVDTHVKRTAYRIGITQHKEPEKVEEDIKRSFREEDWRDISFLLILLGRYICKAKKPLCDQCPLEDLCKKRI